MLSRAAFRSSASGSKRAWSRGSPQKRREGLKRAPSAGAPSRALRCWPPPLAARGKAPREESGYAGGGHLLGFSAAD
eukprot:11460139-Alexandrium_andersonii.AAC.1